MIEALEIDPFDSNHWVYGTGETIYGGHNLKSWPNVHVSSLADGVEEESVQYLITPPGIGAPLISAVGDDGGFVHYDLDKSPSNTFQNPYWSTTNALDYAGLRPKNVLRIGNSQLATSSDAGVTWTLNTVVPSTASGGTIAYGADASTIVWASSAGNLLIATNSSSESATLPAGVSVVSDKVNPKYFYAGNSAGVYVSSDGGQTFNSTAKITSYAGVKIKVHPAVAGDVWFSADTGIYHSTDFGQTFTQSPGVQWAEDITIGKGSGSYANVYAFNTIGDVAALRVSKDIGKTWTVISDVKHGFGSASANCLAASWETEGLVFVGTNGRGIFYGLP
jgi:xyloglucan-specific exo-beta-1,4-glucanase